MSILCFDEIWVREPRLMVPRMQPLGPVRVQREHPLASGLVLDYQIGIDLRDYAGNGQLGIATGTTLSASNIGRARRFNGSSDFINLGDTSAVDFGDGQYAVEMLAIPLSTSFNCPLAKDAESQRQLSIEISSGGMPANSVGFVHFRADTFYHGQSTNANTYTAGNLYHVVCQRASGGIEIWINGTNMALNAFGGNVGLSTMAHTTSSLNIGRREYVGSNQYSNIDIFFVRAYKRALSGAQIRELYLNPWQFYVPA